MVFLYYAGQIYDYDQLQRAILVKDYGCKLLYQNDPYEILFSYIHSMFYEYPLIVLDGTIPESECLRIGYDVNRKDQFSVKSRFKNFDEFYYSLIKKNINWQITLLTSGTTGRPKSVTHSLQTIARNVKAGDKYISDSWALCYNPTHIAGIQVFLQAYINRNPIYYLFDDEIKNFTYVVNKYMINRVSATPTYYKNVIMFDQTQCPSIVSVTCGGEKFENILIPKIKNKFPNARIYNIYAATEFGSLFQSDGDNFLISNELKDLVKIDSNGELLVHTSILAKNDIEYLQDDSWYHTGDIVEKLDDRTFRFKSRISSFINVGGYKVNPYDIQEKILEIDFIIDASVYGVKNSITGNIIAADIIIDNSVKKSELEIRNTIKQTLKNSLQAYEIPRIINIVEKFDMGRTGKRKNL